MKKSRGKKKRPQFRSEPIVHKSNTGRLNLALLRRRYTEWFTTGHWTRRPPLSRAVERMKEKKNKWKWWRYSSFLVSSFFLLLKIHLLAQEFFALSTCFLPTKSHLTWLASLNTHLNAVQSRVYVEHIAAGKGWLFFPSKSHTSPSSWHLFT